VSFTLKLHPAKTGFSKKSPFSYRDVYFCKVLVNNSSCPYVQMTNFRVSHLALRQSYGFSGCFLKSTRDVLFAAGQDEECWLPRIAFSFFFLPVAPANQGS
jgi:hypothetical protein